jgi:endonuclease/exonuclease/phosphatase (EEP) superfamily protein YafD
VTGRSRRLPSLAGVALLGMSMVGAVVVVVVAYTGIQERSARFMALSGMSTAVAAACALCAVVGAALVVWAGRWRWFAFGALLPCVVALQLNWTTTWGLLRPERAQDGSALTVLAQNLWYLNEDLDHTAQAVLARDADVVVLTEYTPAAADAFHAAGLREQYRYRWEVEQSFGKGIAVASRLPFDPPQDLGLSGPGARLQLEVGADEVTLFAVHTNAPSSVWDLPRWQSDMAALIEQVDGAGPETIVAGDFNATSGHRRFRELLRRGDLRDVQDVGGGGFANTWPAGSWLPTVLRLDHILVGPGIGVESFTMLPDIGSDHLGVEAQLRVLQG